LGFIDISSASNTFLDAKQFGGGIRQMALGMKIVF
jgi:hypothetical protein